MQTNLTLTIGSVSLPTIDLFYLKQCLESGSVESTTFWLPGSGSGFKSEKIVKPDPRQMEINSNH